MLVSGNILGLVNYTVSNYHMVTGELYEGYNHMFRANSLPTCDRLPLLQIDISGLGLSTIKSMNFAKSINASYSNSTLIIAIDSYKNAENITLEILERLI